MINNNSHNKPFYRIKSDVVRLGLMALGLAAATAWLTPSVSNAGSSGTPSAAGRTNLSAQQTVGADSPPAKSNAANGDVRRAGGMVLLKDHELHGPVPREMQVQPPAVVFVPSALSPSLLNENQELKQPVTDAQIGSWRQELSAKATPKAQAIRIHLWLGEVDLAREAKPYDSIPEFDAVLGTGTAHTGDRTTPEFWLAYMDKGVALLKIGETDKAREIFHSLLNSKEPEVGLDRRKVARAQIAAGLQSGSENRLRSMGIPDTYQGTIILCVVEYLVPSGPGQVSVPKGSAMAHMAKGAPGHVISLPHGSTFQDIANAAAKFGYKSRLVVADDQGLIDLPKPLVAYVQRRHFATVTEADNSGVTYQSPGCCAGINQTIRLTWKQWHFLDPGLYLTMTYKGSKADQLMVSIASGQDSEQVAFNGNLKALHRTVAPLSPLVVRLKKHIHYYLLQALYWRDYRCGGKFAFTDPDPLDGHPIDGDPVDLATGEEAYTTPSPDLTVYNPHGPSVSWGRLYGSLRSPGENYTSGDPSYECADYGVGWSQSYNIEVYDPSNGDITGTIDRYVEFPNGGSFTFTATSTPTSSNPVVHCVVQLGHPVMVDWDYDGSALGHYTITFANRSKWITNGVNVASSCYSLASIQDANGNALNLTYSTPAGYPGRPLLSSITSSGTTLLTILRAQDGTGNIMSVSDCYGRTFYYHVGQYPTYNVASGYPQFYQELDHVSQIAPTNTVPSPDLYVYTYQNWPNTQVNSNGAEAVPYLYTVSAPSPTGVPGQMSTITFNMDPVSCRITSVVDANGNTRNYYPCDQYGNIQVPVAGAGDLGVATNYTLVRVTDSSQNVVTSSIVGYDNLGELSSKTDSAGHLTYQVTQWDPVSLDRPAQTIDGNGAVTNYTWDQFANLLTETGPRGDKTTITYQYPSDLTVGQVQSETRTSSGGVSQTPTTFTYYQPSDGHLNGFVKTVSSPVPGTVGSSSTITSTFTYDSLGDLLTASSNAANNATSGFTTTYNYTSDPTYGISLTGPNIGQPLTITDNLGHTSHIQYNTTIATTPTPGSWQLGGPTRIEDALGNTTDIAYNIAGQPFMTVRPATGETGTGRGYTMSNYLFPGGPCLSQQVYSEQNTTSPTYPSSFAPVRQANFNLGAMGEHLSTAIYNVSSGTTQVIGAYTYDPDYRITAFSDANANTTHYYYNSAGYLAAITYPGYQGNSWPAVSGADSISFPLHDGAGNVLERIDGRGLVTNYVYNDPDSHLTDIKYTGASQNNVHFTYDGFGRMASKTDGATGLLDSNGNVLTPGVVYAYDDLDEATSVQTTYDAPTSGFLPTKTIGYSYYSDGSLQSESTPAGSFSFAYDAGGKLASLTNPYSEATSYAYFNNNWLQSVTSVPATTTYTLDALGKLIGQSTVQGTTTLSSYSAFGYDGEGNQLANAGTITGQAAYSGSNSYGFDFRDTLTSSAGTQSAQPTNTTFAVDPDYNLTTLRGSSLSYNADDQLTGTPFVYDGNGNPTTYQSDTLTFDPENRLTSVMNGTSTLLTAGYSGLNRVWKQNGAGTRTYFLYDGSTPVCELDASGNVIATNTFGPTGLVSRYSGTSSTFYQYDPQGNPTLRLTSAGAVIGAGVFDPYGVHTTSDSSTDPYSGYHGSEGYYSDQETGLQLLGARYYDPGVGRFLNRDPIGYLGGPNPYAYCMGDPIGGSDPLGLDDDITGANAAHPFSTPNDPINNLNNSLNSNSTINSLRHLNNDLGSSDPLQMAVGIDDTIGNFQNGLYGLSVGKGDTVDNEIAVLNGAGQFILLVGTDGLGEEVEGAVAGKGGCFVAGTSVQMADGPPETIENVHDGDKVISRDSLTGKTEIKTVLNTTVHQVHDLVVLHFANKKPGKEIDKVTTTAVHPFYVKGKGFVPAGQLAVGNSIVTRDGPSVVIIKIEDVHLEEAVPVYNLTVADDHTYFVGAANGGEWVHNAWKCDGNGMPFPKNYPPEEHHWIPKPQRPWARRAGINIEHYVTTADGQLHDSYHYGSGGGEYSEDWNEYEKANPNASASQILDFLDTMVNKYGR